MILGQVKVDLVNGVVHTHRDTHALNEDCSAVVRQPFWPAAIVFGFGLSAMGFAFHDILTTHELLMIGITVVLSMVTGWFIARLKLRSRVLRSGDELADSVWGTLPSVNAIRREIGEGIGATRRRGHD